MPDVSPELLALGFIWYVAFLFSTTCHEAAHALAAKIGGDDTAFAGGQVSLNPVPHIQREPWGMVVIPILSLIATGNLFGWASAPYDPVWERRHPRRAAWMALAGPATNYTLMLIAAVILRLGWTYHWLHVNEDTGRADFATSVLGVFFFLNLLLGTFNLLPGSPALCATWTGFGVPAMRCSGWWWRFSRFPAFLDRLRVPQWVHCSPGNSCFRYFGPFSGSEFAAPVVNMRSRVFPSAHSWRSISGFGINQDRAKESRA